MSFKFILFYYYLKYRFFLRIKSKEKLLMFQKIKIKKHLNYVSKNSKFYSKYKKKELSEFPIVNKEIMMKNFDEMNTVGIKKEKAYEIAVNSEKIRNFKEKYNNITVGLSSGTSGNRGLFLASDFERAKWAGIILAKLLPNFIFEKQKIALFLRADSELYNTVNSKILKFKFFDMILDIEKNIEILNDYDPDTLIAPASVLKILAENIINLNINPKRIFSCAEVLTKEDKRFISESFNLEIGEIYQATEGFLGYSESGRDTIKINEDTLFIEKEYIDEEKKRFIPIITDFERISQPIIRYRLNDIWIEKKDYKGIFLNLIKVEGREDDIFLFYDNNKNIIQIFPDFIRRAVMFSSEKILEYRVVQKGKKEIEISFLCKERKYKEIIQRSIISNLESLLLEYKINIEDIEIKFSDYVQNDKLTKNRRITRAF